MPMIIMEYVSLSWVARTGRSAYPNRGDATLLLSQVGRSSWCRPAAKQTKATKAEKCAERASQPIQNDIGICAGWVPHDDDSDVNVTAVYERASLAIGI
jgi:hypothetical protein